MTGTHAYDRIHPEVLEALAAGKLPGIEKLISKKISIDEVVAQGFETLLAEKDTQGELGDNVVSGQEVGDTQQLIRGKQSRF